MSKTAEIVLNWINNEIQLKPKIKDIHKSFSNGYLFSKLFFILKLITKEEFSQFLNTENYTDKKSNFTKIEKICQNLFNLIIPAEDINLIINKDYSKAVVLLYKIRNCIYKNNIHFNDIQIFGNVFSNNEIQNQIKEIIKRQFYSQEEEDNNKSKHKNIINNSDYNFDDNGKSEIYEEEKNTFNRNIDKYNLDDDIKEEVEENNDISNELFVNLNNNTSKKNNRNKKRKLPSIKIKRKTGIKYENNQINDIKNNLLLKPKNALEPINLRLLKNKCNSCENIFAEQNKNYNNNKLIKYRFNNQSDFSNRILYPKLINVSQFNKKLEDLGVTSNDYKLEEETNSLEIENSNIINLNKNLIKEKAEDKNDFLYDSISNTKTVDEVRSELRNKIKYKKIENKIKQKEIKRELSQKKIDDCKAEINFLRINKNKFFDKNKSMSLFFKNYSNKSLLRRKEYSKEVIKRFNKENNYEKNNFYISNFYQNKNKNLSILLSKRKFNLLANSPKEENNFSPKRYFEKLNKLNYFINKMKSERKHKIRNYHTKIMKEIILFIIDMAMEAYIYQKLNKTELMDLNTYIKFNIFFLRSKPLREKLIIIEDNEYKRSSILEENIDIDKLISCLTNEEKYLIQDYIYYLGIWNDEKIYDNNLRGLKLEYKFINNNNSNINSFNSNYFGINEYEPTVLENEDLTLPKNNINNNILGNTIIDVLEHNFNDSNNNILSNNETKIVKKINSLINTSKWDYIPYKIALVGYPLSGRKTVSEKINMKYPNIKIYSINKILKDYYELFLKYSDPPEKPIKNKNPNKKPKKNEIEKSKSKAKENIFEKQEREKKLREMQDIIDIIQPYIDYQQNINNMNTSSGNNISKVDNNQINNEFFIMQDENICKLLIKKIEKDFPFIDQEKIDKNSIEFQKNIHDLQNQIEAIKKRKLEAKKPNPKDDISIEKLEKEIASLKEKSIYGFILVDYPINIKQCYLLENYLTGFIDDKRKPKTNQNKIIENISSIIDFKIEPKEKILHQKSGLNFLIHISTKENIIDERFNSIKYDPVDDKIYTSPNLISDKKIIERLVDEIPYFPKELFEYYKDEYNTNIKKIINLYSQFGFTINSNIDESDIIQPINNNNLNNSKNETIIKTYQYIESEEIKQIDIMDERKKNKKRAAKKSPKKNGKDKGKEIEKNIITTTNSNSIESTNQDKVYNFICKHIIEKLFIEKEKNEKELFYKAYPEYITKEQNDINFTPDLDINEIRTKYKKNKTTKKQIRDVKLIDYDANKINIMINRLILFNKIYNKNLGKFIHLTSKQKKNIYERLNLVQTKFRNFINKKSDKKKIITNFIKKYNHIFKLDPNLLENQRVINELISDIEELRTEIWKIIIKKQNLSIMELKEIKNCGFIQCELVKFYYNIKDLIELETEKFVTILSSMTMIYTKKKEKEKEKSKEINELREEFENEIIIKKEIIMKNVKPFNYYLNSRKEAIFDNSIDEIVEIILENIETIFKNSIKLLFSYNDIIDNILKRIKKIIYNNTITDKKSFKLKRKKRKYSEKKLYSLSMMNELLTNKDSGYIQEEIIKNIFLNEKNKYKFRICYIKSFAIKYIHIMKCSTENIFNNMDEWIVKNVALQNESLNYLIKSLKQFLTDKKPIDQKNDIDCIELDEFEKVIDDEEYNNNNSNIKSFNNNYSYISNYNGSSHEVKLKPFDNSSIINMNRIYNKIKLEYLINDNFIDTKIEEIVDKKVSKNKKKLKIIPSSGEELGIENNITKKNLNNEDLNSSSGILKSKIILNDTDFYFDLEKFKFIYKYIKKYEIEDGIIIKDIFFIIFIKQYLFFKKRVVPQNNIKDDEEENIAVEHKKSINNLYNGEINDNPNFYPAICKALKNLRAKQIQKILDIFIINIEKINYISFEKIINTKENIISEENEFNKEKKEIEKDLIKRKDRKKVTNKTIRNKKNEESKDKNIKKDINEDKSKDKNKKSEEFTLKEIKEEDVKKVIDDKSQNNKEKEKEEEKEIEKNIEYETFLNTKEIFTILALIGVNVLTIEMEEKIDNELKEKYIMKKYLTKNNFLEYKFWFEPFFDYLNDKKENEDMYKGMRNIKEFLFDIWKIDNNSNYIDFKKFIEVLKVNKYVTDFADFNDIRYYDIIFYK